jgi:protein-S-isoprenylcysteine O-methyltransferase Ste14
MSLILQNAFYIISTLALFGLVHTFLASNKVKRFIYNKNRYILPYYRLFYNIISVIFLIVIYMDLPSSNIVIYDLPNPYDFIVLGLQFLSLAGFIWTLKYFSVKELMGLSQIKRSLESNYDFEQLDERSSFITRGIYRFTRHPLYLFSILFFLFRPYMDLNYLIIFSCFVIYFYIGSVYEEKKLVEKFGDAYRNYQKSVPRIFPLRTFQR